MGLFDKLFLGVDLDEEQKRGEDLDRQLQSINNKALESGTHTKEWFEIAEANRIAGQTGNVREEVGDEFKKGIEDGINNIRGVATSAIDWSLGSVLKMIPWQVWVGLAIALFVWMGGLSLLKGSLTKK